MAPIKKKLSREEILLRKRLKEKERYQKMKDDPIKKELMKEKERKKYENKKLKKQVKSIKDMTPREARVKRKQWRKNANSYNQRKKQAEAIVLPDTPTISDEDDPEPVNFDHTKNNSGRKRIRRDRSKIIQRNKRLKAENEILKKSRDKYKKRYYREINKHNNNKEMTPKTKVKELMKNKNRSIVARRLLFGEVLEAQMKFNLRSIKSSNKKHSTLRGVLGNAEMLKKYRLMKHIQRIGFFRPDSRVSTNNYLAKRRLASYQTIVKNEIKRFLEEDENSRMAPGKKDTVTRKKQKFQKRYLNDTMKNLHRKFVSTTCFKPSYSYFCKNRPFWIVYQTLQERQTCLCQKHENANYIVSSLKQLKVVNGTTAKEIAEEMCCEGYKVNCLLRKCHTCVSKSITFNQYDCDADVFYNSWVQKKDTYKDKTGKVKFVKNVVKLRVKTTALSLVNKLLDIITRFMAHEAVIRSQYSALKFLKLNMTETEALLHVDFSENYSCKFGEEIQSYHLGVGSR